jgi:hypothetical protein
MPSVDIIAVALLLTATKVPLPYVIETQLFDAGKVRAIQVIPSGEYAAAVPLDTAMNIPLP